MSNVIDALYELKYNPFKYSEHIASFYAATESVKENLLLAPLVIPLCSHPVFGEKLSGGVFGKKRRSTIWTVFSDRSQLHDLQERIDGFQSLTQRCIQHCLANDWVSIDSDKLTIHSNAEQASAYNNQKNAAKLGKLLSDHAVVEIYAFLGVKPL